MFLIIHWEISNKSLYCEVFIKVFGWSATAWHDAYMEVNTISETRLVIQVYYLYMVGRKGGISYVRGT